MVLKELKELHYQCENLIATFRNLNVKAKEVNATQEEILAAQEAHEKWIQVYRKYKRCCIQYVTELIHGS